MTDRIETIRERHVRREAKPIHPFQQDAHEDEAVLLAEVDRLTSAWRDARPALLQAADALGTSLIFGGKLRPVAAALRALAETVEEGR
jgi:hypothetical protein